MLGLQLIIRGGAGAAAGGMTGRRNMEIAPKMCVHHRHKHKHYHSHVATGNIFVQTLWRLPPPAQA